jgi:hypothetical protein
VCSVAMVCCHLRSMTGAGTFDCHPAYTLSVTIWGKHDGSVRLDRLAALPVTDPKRFLGSATTTTGSAAPGISPNRHKKFTMWLPPTVRIWRMSRSSRQVFAPTWQHGLNLRPLSRSASAQTDNRIMGTRLFD